MGQGQLKEKRVDQVVLNYRNIQKLTKAPEVNKRATPPDNSNHGRIKYLSPYSPDDKATQSTRITKSRGKSVIRRRDKTPISINRRATDATTSELLSESEQAIMLRNLGGSMRNDKKVD